MTLAFTFVTLARITVGVLAVLLVVAGLRLRGAVDAPKGPTFAAVGAFIGGGLAAVFSALAGAILCVVGVAVLAKGLMSVDQTRLTAVAEARAKAKADETDPEVAVKPGGRAPSKKSKGPRVEHRGRVTVRHDR